MAQTKVTKPGIADDAVETTTIKNLNVTAAKLSTDAVETTKIKDLNVTNAKIAAGTIDITAKITGTVPSANLGTGTASSSTILYGDQTYKAEPTTNLTPLRQDIITLALKQGVQENMTKHNLPSSAVVTFQADADYNSGGSTDITRNASKYISTVAAPGPFGGNDSYTELLIHGDGSDASTTITDSSKNGLTTNVAGTMQLDTAQKKFGTASCYYDSNTATSGSSFMYWAENAAFQVGTGDFTIDWWVRFKDQVPNSTFIFQYGDGWWTGNQNFNYFCNFGANNLGCSVQVGSTVVASSFTSGDLGGNWALDTWYHCAMERFGTSLKTYVNGVAGSTVGTLGASDSVNQTYYNVHSGWGKAGGGAGSNFYMDGWLDELRFSKGIARFQGNFTPPVEEYGSGSTSATGTALGTTNVPTSAVTEVSGVMLMKNAYGTNTLGTDVKVYFTADNSNWTEAASYTDSGTFSDTTKQITLGKTTVTSGSDVRWKIVFANQVASSKVAEIYGIGTNY